MGYRVVSPSVMNCCLFSVKQQTVDIRQELVREVARKPPRKADGETIYRQTKAAVRRRIIRVGKRGPDEHAQDVRPVELPAAVVVLGRQLLGHRVEAPVDDRALSEPE